MKDKQTFGLFIILLCLLLPKFSLQRGLDSTVSEGTNFREQERQNVAKFLFKSDSISTINDGSNEVNVLPQNTIKNKANKKYPKTVIRPQTSSSKQKNKLLSHSKSSTSFSTSRVLMSNMETTAEPQVTSAQKSIYSIGRYSSFVDQCFRRYDNCTIINALPFERRSGLQVQDCKAFCLKMRYGFYACKSFTFDWANQVCDLFNHLGNQLPSKLMDYDKCDYYELESSFENCLLEQQPLSNTVAMVKTDGNELKYSPVMRKTLVEARIDDKKTLQLPYKDICSAGNIAGYLRISNFELHGNDHYIIDNIELEQCLDYCTNNEGNPKMTECRSFDYTEGRCILSAETAVPLGSGQLKQNLRSDYYEKICIDQHLMRNCSRVFDRFPQMILVGYAEVVVDAPNFEDCFRNCLNSSSLYGINCISGLYYFEEPKLNCILNVENRRTQEHLFAEEESDYVDYFEINCRREDVSGTDNKKSIS